MNDAPHFLDLDDALDFHAEEIKRGGGSLEIRDIKALKSALGAPQASFGGGYLMDIFEMAATYVNSIAGNHPFLDGNKRTAAAAALTFLYINGYEIDEAYDDELADKIIDLLAKKISKVDLAHYFKTHSRAIG
jgi:death-on-curing protein